MYKIAKKKANVSILKKRYIAGKKKARCYTVICGKRSVQEWPQAGLLLGIGNFVNTSKPPSLSSLRTSSGPIMVSPLLSGGM